MDQRRICKREWSVSSMISSAGKQMQKGCRRGSNEWRKRTGNLGVDELSSGAVAVSQGRPGQFEGF